MLSSGLFLFDTFRPAKLLKTGLWVNMHFRKHQAEAGAFDTLNFLDNLSRDRNSRFI